MTTRKLRHKLVSQYKLLHMHHQLNYTEYICITYKYFLSKIIDTKLFQH